MKPYKAQSIEKKWQDAWEANGHPKRTATKGKYFVLDMFPYPSGDGLHVGHVENYTATDILSRYKRMQGFDVLHPIGWDAFGLPAENFAIKTGIHPDQKTHENIRNFTRQIKSLGMSYDWDREIDTSSPEYYKWTQWMFLFLYKNGLAYKKKAHVNWCPSCQTVLANEQVIDGKCDRCKSEVIQKELEQWFFKITDFVEDTVSKDGKRISGLLSGLDAVDWPHSTQAAQRNWIGRSEGTTVKFQISPSNKKQVTSNKEEKEYIEVFTTRVDTIYGCTYVVVAPEHPLLKNQESRIKNQEEVEEYLKTTAKKTDLERTELNKDKTGVKLEGVEAINPFTGESVPIFVADYVLGNYGTGAVMAVPAHDERDYEFAKKYKLPIKSSIAPYIELTGGFAPRKDKETVTRECATGIVLSEDGSRVLLLRRKENGIYLFVGGRIEEGETAREAMKREVIEETGYTDFDIVRVVIPQMHGNGFVIYQDVNKLSTDTVFEIHLKSDEKKEIAAEESAMHDVLWVERDKVATLPGLADHHEYMWKMLEGGEKAFCDDGIVFDSGEYTGFASAEAREKMTVWLEEKKLGARKVNYRLRDWLISRQRYWGAPIPIIYCDDCALRDPSGQGIVPVPEEDLPVELPTDVDFRPTGESPLLRSESFQKVNCPKCGKKARREADTMDTFVCSSWYYLRFADPNNTERFADPKKLEELLPVDFYMGGAEHTVLHLLYARFFTKALAKHGYLTFDEPFMKLRHQGMVLAEDGRKMSKSLGNVVNPDVVVGEFGADTLRLYEMFMGPLEDMKSWNTGSIVGLRRFLEKVWKLQEKVTTQKYTSRDFETLFHQTIQKVTDDIENLKYNTAVSSMMILVNAMEKEKEIFFRFYGILLILLSPFAPHITEELWEKLHTVLGQQSKSIHLENWPEPDTDFLKAREVYITVQINGKKRAVLNMPAECTEEVVKEAALADANVQTHIAGKEIRKVIFVPDKILNMVV